MRCRIGTWSASGAGPEPLGQIAIVPQEPNFVGSNFPHSGPWDYLQDVPLLWYGPGIVPALGEVRRHTLADIAPSQAALLGFDFPDVDGRRLPEIETPATPPRLIVTLVWDAGGRSVLDEFPDDWPGFHRLIPHGIWYANADVGSSPSITPATHATIGTGEFPMHTGQTDAEFFLGDDLVRAGGLGPLLMPGRRSATCTTERWGTGTRRQPVERHVAPQHDEPRCAVGRRRQSYPPCCACRSTRTTRAPRARSGTFRSGTSRSSPSRIT